MLAAEAGAIANGRSEADRTSGRIKFSQIDSNTDPKSADGVIGDSCCYELLNNLRIAIPKTVTILFTC